MSHLPRAKRPLHCLVLAALSAGMILTPVGVATAVPPQPRPVAAVPTAVPVTKIKPKKVKLAGVRDMVHVKKHLFVSAGNEVRVLNENGKTRKRLKKLPGAQGMVVSPKGDRVYVAVHDADLIVAVDTRKLKVVKRFKVGQCPTELALTGGRLFYARDECDALEASIESIDPSKGGLPIPSGIPQVNEPAFLLGGGDTLVMAPRSSSSPTVKSFRVTGPEATLQSSLHEDGYVDDLAISPDGSTVYVPHNYPGEVRAYPTTTMSGPVSYTTGNFIDALAVSSDGRQLTATTGDSGPDLFAFDVASGSMSLRGSTVWPGTVRPNVHAGTLTFSDDGKKVFELFAGYWEGPVYLVSAKTRSKQTS